MTVPGSPHPLARHHQLVISEAAEHSIVYDERSHHIHQLNRITAAAWRRCDGQQPLADIQRLVSLDLEVTIPVEAINAALVQLSDADLLETPWVSVSPPQRQSRRSLLRKTVIAGAIAAPTLISISAPQAAAALSCRSEVVSCLGNCCEIGEECTNFGCCFPEERCDPGCCRAPRVCRGGTCCDPQFVCVNKCCPQGDCYKGMCCPEANRCLFQCCQPGQICIDDNLFGKCQW